MACGDCGHYYPHHRPTARKLKGLCLYPFSALPGAFSGLPSPRTGPDSHPECPWHERVAQPDLPLCICGGQAAIDEGNGGTQAMCLECGMASPVIHTSTPASRRVAFALAADNWRLMVRSLSRDVTSGSPAVSSVPAHGGVANTVEEG